MNPGLEAQLHDTLEVAKSVFIDNGGDLTKPHRIVIEIFETDDEKKEDEQKSGMAQFEVSAKQD